MVNLTLLLSLIFIAFALPAAPSKPNGVPIGVAGPPPAAALPLALAGLLPGIVLVLAFRNQTWLQIGTLFASPQWRR
ncbi:hypothetical protein [Mycolicibacterium confluentis]|uniref:Uncharacterized protein n=1 Tax=Mycolicibacterium confluentis TaxID=28047 RepID=A0A7I7Y1U7_9MYCO|nr:hypothetical protein [Mycolicibacterium confluentis]MCV7320559.1 hypothetical protein [Mycolicibacterium confluentis]ORV30212.1 hypothetical protein AWB99_14000 [Mycolicibacterium confluentis]BBZ35598.1 hypothetical protein MCNF_42030 [Mycolicibacterium confluentis]